MSRYSSAGATGRQLLNLKRRLSTESDPEVIRSLRRREVRLLITLGQTEPAASRADALVGDHPLWPEAHSLHADVLSRLRDWEGAEEEFGMAADLHLKSGEEGKAGRLMHGPLFRLAEARGGFGRCIELVTRPALESPVLKSRALRMAGNPSGGEGLPQTDDHLQGALLLLERAHGGGSIRELLEVVDEWPASEPEWRWRVLVEGVALWQDRDMDCRGWRKQLRKTVRPVLDPRFDREVRSLDTALSPDKGGDR